MAPLIFISARSDDCQYAGPLYQFLKSRGLDVFFSQESLPEMASSDYRKQIDDALDRAHHMIVVTSSRANVTSPWVEAEWGLFINEKRSGRKEGNLITVAAAGLKPADLPASLRYYEVIPFETAAFEKILRYVATPREVPRPSPVRATPSGKPLADAGMAGEKGLGFKVSDRRTFKPDGTPRAKPLGSPPNVAGSAAVARAPVSGKAPSSPSSSTTKLTVHKPTKNGAIAGALLGFTGGLFAAFYAIGSKRGNAGWPEVLLCALFGALFGSKAAESLGARIFGVGTAIVGGVIGAIDGGPWEGLTVGLFFGTLAAAIAVSAEKRLRKPKK